MIIFNVRVTEWAFDPGDKIGQHIYEYDYFFVSIKDGILKIINKDGLIILSELKQGISYFMECINNNVINKNKFHYSFI